MIMGVSCQYLLKSLYCHCLVCILTKITPILSVKAISIQCALQHPVSGMVVYIMVHVAKANVQDCLRMFRLAMPIYAK
jgi:hypothetical protein